MESIDFYFKFFIGMIAVVNPVGAVPIFLNACQDQTREEKKVTVNTASLTVFTVLLISLLSGEAILRLFGISMASFRVAGGVLIFLMAMSMLQAQVSPAKQTEEEAKRLKSKVRENVSVVPLGIPLMAGPGAMSSVVLSAQKHSTFAHYGFLFLVIASVALVSWIILRTAPVIAEKLGQTGINIITRIMGLLMAAIGIEFMASGVKMLFPVLESIIKV